MIFSSTTRGLKLDEKGKMHQQGAVRVQVAVLCNVGPTTHVAVRGYSSW
jgi:hypothetical protein